MKHSIQAIHASASDTRACPVCDAGTAVRSTNIQEFAYGTGDGAVTLRAHVPFWSCPACGDEWVDEEGEAAQHAAVCRHLDRATPTEVKTTRVMARMTQKEFAAALHAGVASVKRWEAGTVMPNRSATATIRAFRADRRDEAVAAVFRTPTPPASIEAAARFSLRQWHPGQTLAAAA